MIVLVTGGNRGIGFGIVQAITQRIPNATILIGCREIKSGEESISKLQELGVTATLDTIKVDVEDDDTIAAAAEVVRTKYRKLDGMLIASSVYCYTPSNRLAVLINNAAQMTFASSSELSEVRSAMNKNVNNAVTSQAIVTRAFLPLLRQSEFPRVIMVSSARGSLGMTAKKEAGLQHPPMINT